MFLPYEHDLVSIAKKATAAVLQRQTFYRFVTPRAAHLRVVRDDVKTGGGQATDRMRHRRPVTAVTYSISSDAASFPQRSSPVGLQESEF
jgi:hypothetical protein